jgi:nitrate/nitrite transport system ATP-binding protein
MFADARPRSTMSAPFLELNGVTKRYGVHTVLRDVTLSIAQGEFVAIVGFSGAGKTTLINLIAGLTMPDSGTVQLKGEPIAGPGADRGVVFQNYALLPWLTVFENVALAVDAVFPRWSEEQRAAHVERHLAMVNLTGARDKRPRQLSGGMRSTPSRAARCKPKSSASGRPIARRSS